MAKRAILIAGPTASGKSALAAELAGREGGVVINADSMQVYRELRVLTARPTPEDERAVPHRLYGFRPGAAPFSVGAWRDIAAAEISRAWDGGRVPILVGGTGLYFEALTAGLADIPPIPDAVREKWQSMGVEQGAAALSSELARRDPEMAAQPHMTDPQRMIRALEVIEATGRSLADWQRDPVVPGVLAGVETRRIVLSPPRETVYARADARVGQMLDAGAPEEVRALLAMNLPAGAPVMKAVGVAELAAHFGGEASLEEAAERIRTRTRRYAKRQLTWFRNRMADWEWVEGVGD